MKSSPSMNVARFPFEKTIKPVPNEPRIEAMFRFLHDMPLARQKLCIVEFASEEVSLITSTEADLLMDACGLREV